MHGCWGPAPRTPKILPFLPEVQLHSPPRVTDSLRDFPPWMMSCMMRPARSSDRECWWLRDATEPAHSLSASQNLKLLLCFYLLSSRFIVVVGVGNKIKYYEGGSPKIKTKEKIFFSFFLNISPFSPQLLSLPLLIPHSLHTPTPGGDESFFPQGIHNRHTTYLPHDKLVGTTRCSTLS